MRDLIKLRVGFVGVMCTPFQGDKEAGFAASAEALSNMADNLGFELRVVNKGLYESEQAQAAAEELRAWKADFVLLQTSSFAAGELIYPFTNLPAYLGLWAVPEGQADKNGGLPLNSFAAANLYNSIIGNCLQDYTRPVKWFYGYPGQDLLDQRLTVTVQALTALKNLQGAKVGLIGGVAPGFDNLIVDEKNLYERLGVSVDIIEFEDVIARAESTVDSKLEESKALIRSSAAHFEEAQMPALDKAGRVYSAYQELAEERELDCIAVSCWPRFQEDYHFAVCSVLGAANDVGLIAACEGDVASALSMLALKYMSGGAVVTLMDLVSLDEEDESILLWHCGPTAPSLADGRGVRMQSLWLFDGYEGEPIGLHNDLILKPGHATVMGFTVDFKRMLVLEGEVEPSKPSYVGSRSWLKELQLNGEPVSVRQLVQTIMDSSFQHHYPIVYGHLADSCLELAAWLDVDPIPRSTYTPYIRRT